MVDREKIIKGLGDISAYFRSTLDAMIGGTFACELFRVYAETAESAIALLKAQEPVRPIPGLWDRDIQLFNCGACGGEIGAKGISKYCSHCGRAVKWK